MPCWCSVLHHVLELGDRAARAAHARVLGVRREVADRVVAPVVAQAALEQEAVVDERVDRQQLDRGDAEPLQVRGSPRGARGRRRCRAAAPGTSGCRIGEALDVRLVDHRLVPRDLEPAIVAPVEVRLHDDRAERVRRAVLGRHRPPVVGCAPRSAGPQCEALGDRARVRIDEQLVRVAAQAARRIPRAVDAIAVALPGPDLRQVARARPGRCRGRAAIRRLVGARPIEQAQLDALGDAR